MTRNFLPVLSKILGCTLTTHRLDILCEVKYYVITYIMVSTIYGHVVVFTTRYRDSWRPDYEKSACNITPGLSVKLIVD